MVNVFCLEKGDWDKVNYLVPESVDHNGNVKIVTPGEYPMFKWFIMVKFGG